LIFKRKAEIKQRDEDYRAGSYDRPQRMGAATTYEENMAAHQRRTNELRKEVKTLQRLKRETRSEIGWIKHKIDRAHEGATAIGVAEAAAASRTEAVYETGIRAYRAGANAGAVAAARAADAAAAAAAAKAAKDAAILAKQAADREEAQRNKPAQRDADLESSVRKYLTRK
jgi:colicin import membrane protein